MRSVPKLPFIESTSVKPGRGDVFGPIESIWRQRPEGGSRAKGETGLPPRGPSPASKVQCNLLQFQEFPHPATIANRCAISPMQGEKALLYAPRSRTFVSLIPR